MTTIRTLFAAALLLACVGISSQAWAQGCDTATYDHNGSRMLIHACDGGGFTIEYDRPRKGLAAQGVRPGTVLFQGSFWDSGGPNPRRVRGTAKLFKRGCRPAGYEVDGYWMADDTLQMSGRAPIRRNGCRVSGTRNDDLRFTPY